MANDEIARTLAKIADLLDSGRANPWRVRAYRRAARAVERHDRQVAAMLADGEPLTALPGVGAELARLIEELARTGRARILDELRAGEPAPSAGTRRRGRGPEERPLRLTEAAELARALVAFLVPAAEKVEAAGGVRRKLERIDHLELLAAAADPRPVLDRLAAHAGLEELAVDGARATARLRGALPVSVEVVPPSRWGSALVAATGPAEHLRALRPPARAYASEAAVYRARGLPLVPPELRGDGSELAVARAGGLPRLVEPHQIRGDLQMHTEWSDGTSTVARMAAACRRRGYQYLAITDHSGSLSIAGGLGPEELERQWLEIDEARAAAGIVILKSMEVDILPDGSLDLPASQLAALDCVLAAVHVRQKLPRAAQTERILAAVAHPAVDILGHPTGKRGRRPSYEVDLDAVLRACAERDVAVEIDCSPDRSDLSAEDARRALALGCTLVIDSDAHSQRELGHMEYGVGQARRAGAEPGRVLNARSWPELRRWLQRRGRREALDGLGR